MRDIVFEQTEGCNQFTFKDDLGTDYCFEYHPSIEGLWEDINLADFDVQLLIHPFLNNESNVFALDSIINTVGETVGYLFPAIVLDSDSFEPKRPSDNNYLYVAYRVLLERLTKIDNEVNTLGACFEDNICVCVLNKRTIGMDRGIWDCIHSLRRFGYSYFVVNNRYKKIEGYSINNYKMLLPGMRMRLTFSVPPMYSELIIDGILRSLPNADNIVYRFILLYQIVEFLISKKVSSSINNAIGVYRSSPAGSENDFIETINNVRKERGAIKEIFDECGIDQSTTCIKEFNNDCKHLYNLAGIVPQKSDQENLFYSFRNQMVHSFRHLNNYKPELASVVFDFEQVVLSIVECYPYPKV